MKYPQLVSTPAVVKEWLEAELECLGIDSTAYARTVLSLLARDTIDPAEVIQSGYVLIANKCGRGAAGLRGSAVSGTRGDELKRAEVIECLRSASEDHCGIQLLVDHLISMLKRLPTTELATAGDTICRSITAEQLPTEDPVLRYEAAFPPLSGRSSPSVIPLTFFSKMSAKPSGATLTGWLPVGHREAALPSAADWPASLDLSVLLQPAAACHRLSALQLTASPLELTALPADPPPPKPPEPSADTHFQPIRRVSGGDCQPPATFDARLYTRSDSGGLYLEDEPAPGIDDRPQKYMVYQEPVAGSSTSVAVVSTAASFAPKFKLRANEKYCQTDEAEPADAARDRDLLQILVSGEQAIVSRGAALTVDDDVEDDSSYEVLSSLQATLNNIYEDGSESDTSAAERERRRSAFARVSRAPTGHRPLYLRGGGADSLLAAVYTGGVWSPVAGSSAEPDHRPLYARQPCSTAPAGYAELCHLSSGRISGAVYRQGPTEYPALRYQLAGRDLPEVTFCQLANNATSASAKEDLLSADEAAVWECDSERDRSSQEPSMCDDATWQTAMDACVWETNDDHTADMLLWEAGGDRQPLGDTVLWEARDHSRDKSIDKSIWEERVGAGRRPSADKCVWEPLDDLPEQAGDTEVWKVMESAARPDIYVDEVWRSGDGPTQRNQVGDDNVWESGGVLRPSEATEESRWQARDQPLPADKLVNDAVWEAPSTVVGRDKTAARHLWPPPAHPLKLDKSIDKTLWDSLDDASQHDRSADEALEELRAGALPPRRASTERSLWSSRSKLDDTLWESGTEPEPEPEPEPAWKPVAAVWLSGDAPSWDGDLVRPAEHIWRRGEPTSAWAGPASPEGAATQEKVCRLLWQLGGDDVLTQTGLYPADELAGRARSWEFIDENNVKNKIDKNDADDSGPLASELANEVAGWRMLPALRQLSESLGLTERHPLPDGVALKAWTLEEQWRRDDGPPKASRDRRSRKSDRKRPCSYFMEGNCKRNDCKFSHDLSAITCVFWEESGCFKGATCPFLHGYPPDDEEDDGDSSDSAKRTVTLKSFKLEREDFPSLHNMKKWRRNEEEDGRRSGRRGCRRHKSFSDAGLGVGGGDQELHRAALSGRGKRRRHHSKSEGVRPADIGARRP